MSKQHPIIHPAVENALNNNNLDLFKDIIDAYPEEVKASYRYVYEFVIDNTEFVSFLDYVPSDIMRLKMIINISNYNFSVLNGLKNLNNLQTLNCSNNQLSTLKDVNHLSNLKTLNCNNNELTSLKSIENLSSITSLNCSSNKLTSLKGIENLVILKCAKNKLTSLKGIEKLHKLERFEYFEYFENPLPRDLLDINLGLCYSVQIKEVQDYYT